MLRKSEKLRELSLIATTIILQNYQFESPRMHAIYRVLSAHSYQSHSLSRWVKRESICELGVIGRACQKYQNIIIICTKWPRIYS